MMERNVIKFLNDQVAIHNFPKYNSDRTLENKFINGFNRYKLPSTKSILNKAIWDFRYEYVRRVCFPMISKETIKALAKELKGKRVLELGSGSGILAHHLEKHGVNIVTVDNGAWGGSRWHEKWVIYHRSFKGDALTYFNKNKHKFDVVIMSWPNYRCPLAYNIAKRLSTKQVLIYQGEDWGGCTANSDFHKFSESRMVEHFKFRDRMKKITIQFDGIHDSWVKLRRTR